MKRWVFGATVCATVLSWFLFSRGYLLTRIELRQRSRCTDPIPATLVGNASRGCWMEAVYDRVVIVVVDGLRFDAVVDEHCGREAATTEMPLHVARFPKLMRLIRDDVGDVSRIFKFIADPPTATMQRIKGGLPTLVDVGSSFSGTAVKEDNLLWQLKDSGRRLVFVGDDTWDALFHEELDISIPFDSFNVEDLDTVDDGVRTEFYPLVLEFPELWDFAAGHYLGVDHASHMFAVNSMEVAQKLDQMDEEISTFLEAFVRNERFLEERSLFLMFGDHGMKMDGEHSGGSQEEIETVLVAADLQSLKRQIEGRPREGETEPSCPEGRKIHQMNQIDLAPTLAFLLGVPIPFGNVGKASAELLSLSGLDERHLQRMLHINAWQVDRYLNAYADVSRGQFEKKMERLNTQFSQLMQNEGTVEKYSDYLDAAAAFARLHWTQFHDISILAGGIVLPQMFLGILWSMYFARAIYHQPFIALATVTTVILHGLSYFSNSFIEREGDVVRHMVTTLALLLLRHCLIHSQNQRQQWQVLVLSGITFLSNAINAKLGIMTDTDGARSSKHGYSVTFSVVGYLCLPALSITLHCLGHWIYKQHVFLKNTFVWLMSSACRCAHVIQMCLLVLHWMSKDSELMYLMDPHILARGVYWLAGVAAAVSVPCLVFSPVTRGSRYQLCSFCILRALIPPVVLLSGKIGSVVITSTLWQLIALHQLCFSCLVSQKEQVSSLLFGVLAHYSAMQMFFFTEHTCEFSGLHFTAAFIGLHEFEYYASGFLLALETLSGFILVPLILSLFLTNKQSADVLYMYTTARNCHFLFAMLSANILRRHLWTMKTFAPKFVFEFAFSIVTEFICLLLYPSHSLQHPLKKSR